MRTKIFLLAALFVCPGTTAWCQSWCPPGAEWAFFYTYTDWITSENRVGFMLSQHTGEELVGGEVAQRISHDLYFGINGGPEDQHEVLNPTYTRFNAGVVYIWSTNDAQYDTLLWLSSEIGDHWIPYGFTPAYQFIVTHIDTVEVDGVPLRKSALSLVEMSTSSTLHLDTMYERIGPLYSFLFYTYNIMVDFQQFSFRCYHDEDIDYSVWPAGCDYPLGQAGHAPAPFFEVFPNPGSGLVQFTWPGHNTLAMEVKDALGRTVHREPVLNEPFAVDLSTLPGGMYNVLFIASDGKRATTKWIKQ